MLLVFYICWGASVCSASRRRNLPNSLLPLLPVSLDWQRCMYCWCCRLLWMDCSTRCWGWMVTGKSSQVNARHRLSISIVFHSALLLEQQFYMQMVGGASFHNAATYQTGFAIQDGFSSTICICITFVLPVGILCFTCGEYISHLLKLLFLRECLTNRVHSIFNSDCASCNLGFIE